MNQAMQIELIVKLAIFIAGAILSLIPSLIILIQKLKALKKAKTDEEKMIAINDLKDQAEIFIQGAEVAYEELDKNLKAKGESAGPIKLQSVLVKLEEYAKSKNYSFEFDKEYWTNIINQIVKMTRNVNKK